MDRDMLVSFQRAAALGVALYLQLVQQEEEQKQLVQQEEEQKQSKGKKKKDTSTPAWGEFSLQQLQGMQENMVKQLDSEACGLNIRGKYQNFMRMQPELFYELLEGIRPLIEKSNTIAPEIRLALTLRFLATGENYPSLGFAFEVSTTAIHEIVHDTCRAINQVYRDRFIQSPTTAKGWKEVANGFSDKCNFEHTIGALDGKHIRMRKPTELASLYLNHRNFHSIVLLALADANYKFLWVDIGSEGKAGNSSQLQGVINNSIDNKTKNFPAPSALLYDDKCTLIPYFMVAPDSFALTGNVMTSYGLHTREKTREKDIFDYRLSRASRIIDNAFGILTHRFQCLMTILPAEPVVVKEITMACCTLHNFLCTRNPGQAEDMSNLIR